MPTVCTRIPPPERTQPPRPGGRRLTPGPSQVCAVARKERIMIFALQYLVPDLSALPVT